MPDPRVAITSQMTLNIDHVNPSICFQAIQNSKLVAVLTKSKTFCERAARFIRIFSIGGHY
jgi:hypothetical protein